MRIRFSVQARRITLSEEGGTLVVVNRVMTKQTNDFFLRGVARCLSRCPRSSRWRTPPPCAPLEPRPSWCRAQSAECPRCQTSISASKQCIVGRARSRAGSAVSSVIRVNCFGRNHGVRNGQPTFCLRPGRALSGETNMSFLKAPLEDPPPPSISNKPPSRRTVDVFARGEWWLIKRC